MCQNNDGRQLILKFQLSYFLSTLKGLSQIDDEARAASQNCYLYQIILLTVLAPESICESPLTNKKPLASRQKMTTYMVFTGSHFIGFILHGDY